MKILVTGAAGFIGMHCAKFLLERGDTVLGIDNFNNYYEVSLKKARNSILESFKKYSMQEADITNKSQIEEIYKDFMPDRVIHLAAQAGVRYSLENPQVYIDTNITGFINMLEICRTYSPEHLVYASSSSVYGGNTSLPFHENQNIDHPVSLYAATKKSNELMAHVYSHLFNIPTTGLRFFTVYGPYGRPDMALFLFTKAILEDRPINLFNKGQMQRAFTYVDDIVQGVVRVLDKTASINTKFNPKDPKPSSSNAPFRVFNIGNKRSVSLIDYVLAIEKSVGKDAVKNFVDMEPGDVLATSSSTTLLEEWIEFEPQVNLEDGVNRFVKWYIDYYRK